MDRKRLTHFYDWPSVNEHSFESVLNEFAENGAKELTFATFFTNYVYGNPNKAVSLRKLLDKTGVSMPDAHGLWSGLWDLCAADTFMRPHLAAGHCLCMEILADFGVKTYTVHIGAAECATNGGLFTDAMLGRARETLEAILPTAERLGMVVCVENAFEPANTPEAVAACIEPFKDSPAIGCCLDVGHAHVMDADLPRTDAQMAESWINRAMWAGRMQDGLRPMREAIRTLAPYIVTAHVHDNDGLSDQHLCPGLGNCDFDAVFDELSKCPRLQSIQNETCFYAGGTSIGHACRVFRGLMEKLAPAQG